MKRHTQFHRGHIRLRDRNRQARRKSIVNGGCDADADNRSPAIPAEPRNRERRNSACRPAAAPRADLRFAASVGRGDEDRRHAEPAFPRQGRAAARSACPSCRDPGACAESAAAAE